MEHEETIIHRLCMKNHGYVAYLLSWIWWKNGRGYHAGTDMLWGLKTWQKNLTHLADF